MTRLARVSLALGVVAVSFAAPGVQASPPANDHPAGPTCGYRATSGPSPSAAADDMVAELEAGPLVWDRPFTLHCTVQVGSAAVHHGTANDAARATVAADAIGPAYAAVMSPNDQRHQTISYSFPRDSQDYPCTRVTYAGGTLYWNAAQNLTGFPRTGDETSGYWTTDPSRLCAKRLAEAGAAPSVGSVGDAYDNALAESEIGLYKTEAVRPLRGRWQHVDHVELATLDWVDWHNHRRLHTACCDLTPIEYEQVYYRQHPALAEALVPTS